MNTSRRCEILLSTYNGADYLPELLRSIVQQDHGDMLVSIRDDGSSDAGETVRILQNFAEEHPGTRLRIEPNVGVINSFFLLLKEADSRSEYFALCDQDDIWHSDKVSRAISYFESKRQDLPRLYCARSEFVDRSGKHIGFSQSYRKPLTFGNALVENCARGCTIVLNRKAKELLTKRLPIDRKIHMHDWWCYLVIAAFGEVFFDPEPVIKYRLHAKNEIGEPIGVFKFIASRAAILKRLRSGDLPRSTEVASVFRDTFNDVLTVELRQRLDQFLRLRGGPLSLISFWRYRPAHRQTILGHLMLTALIFANLI